MTAGSVPDHLPYILSFETLLKEMFSSISSLPSGSKSLFLSGCVRPRTLTPHTRVSRFFNTYIPKFLYCCGSLRNHSSWRLTLTWIFLVYLGVSRPFSSLCSWSSVTRLNVCPNVPVVCRSRVRSGTSLSCNDVEGSPWQLSLQNCCRHFRGTSVCLSFSPYNSGVDSSKGTSLREVRPPWSGLFVVDPSP